MQWEEINALCLMLYVHVHAVCSCWWYIAMSMSIQYVCVDAVCLCPNCMPIAMARPCPWACCMYTSTLHIHVHAMSMLLVMSMLHVHAAGPSLCFMIKILLRAYSVRHKKCAVPEIYAIFQIRGNIWRGHISIDVSSSKDSSGYVFKCTTTKWQIPTSLSCLEFLSYSEIMYI